MYDPENLTIVSCTKQDWDLMVSVREDQISRLGEFVEFYQGEVNQTNATRDRFLTDARNGVLVTRGAAICLYQLRDASQGENIYLDVAAFLADKSKESKAYHHLYERVGLQESSPQNNFRRIISCRIPAGPFCNHKINYTTAPGSRIALELVMFVLNSSFSDWFFRLGSTNAAVSHYQLRNIPCPRFLTEAGEAAPRTSRCLSTLLQTEDYYSLEGGLLEIADADGCSSTVQQIIIELVQAIERMEAQRGQISRTARSELSEGGQVCQEILGQGSTEFGWARR